MSNDAQTHNDHDSHASGELGLEQVGRLLSVALAGPRRPVDRAIDRLAAPDGHRWLEHILKVYSSVAVGDARALLLDKSADLNRLVELKKIAKAVLAEEQKKTPSPHATLVYFLAVAAARAHRGVSISSQSQDQIDPVLVDLADAAPKPWNELFEKAALAPANPMNKS